MGGTGYAGSGSADPFSGTGISEGPDAGYDN